MADPIEEAKDDSVKYAFMFVGIGAVSGIAFFLQVLTTFARSFSNFTLLDLHV